MKRLALLILVLAVAGTSNASVHAQGRKDQAKAVASVCIRKKFEFEKSLGALRQYPNAMTAYLLSHKPGDKLDYGVCYNWREMLKREVEIQTWQRTSVPECREYFRQASGRMGRDPRERSRPRSTLEEQIAKYNNACSHTMAGTL
jgi:hypothetical protein